MKSKDLPEIQRNPREIHLVDPGREVQAALQCAF